MILDSMNLAGKVAVVTGAGRGIGRRVATAYAEAGADVALVSRTLEEVETVAAQIRTLGVRALPIEADLGVPEDVERLVATAVKEMGKLDILVNNAGINHRAPTLDFELADFDRILDVNLRGLYYASQKAAQQMVEQGELGMKSGRGFYDWKARDPQALIERRNRQIVHQLAYLKERDLL